MLLLPGQPATPPNSVTAVIASVAVLLLLAARDQTIVATALLTIVADLGGTDHLSWVATPYPLIAAYIVCVGLGLGCIFPVVTTAVQNAVPRDVLGVATAAGIMFRQIGGSLGVALFGAIFAARLAPQLGALASDGPIEIGPQFLAALPPAALKTVTLAVVDSLHPIYLIAAGLAVGGLLVSFLLVEIRLVNRIGRPAAAE